MSIPSRACLPHPLADNVVAFPGVLDRLVMTLGGHDGHAVVVSESTGASGRLAAVLDGRGLALADEPGALLIPVTREEIDALAAFSGPVRAWSRAVLADDRPAMIEAIGDVRAVPVPHWLDVNVEMPARSPVARRA